jgi:hypothetical protein
MALGNLFAEGGRITFKPSPVERSDSDKYSLAQMLPVSVTVSHNWTQFIDIIGKQTIAYY